MNNPDIFYSVCEFAKKLNVHPNTIRRSIKSGKIHAIRIGKGDRASYRIYPEELDRLSLVDMEKIVDKIVEQKLKERSHHDT